MDVVWQPEALGQLAVGVVVAEQQVSLDASLSQPSHLANKKQTSVEVSPIAVIQITSDDHEGDLFVDGGLDQFFESLARGIAKQLDRGAIILTQAEQGAVEVNISCVKELEHSLVTARGEVRSQHPL